MLLTIYSIMAWMYKNVLPNWYNLKNDVNENLANKRGERSAKLYNTDILSS